jgi:hypothetical protein
MSAEQLAQGSVNSQIVTIPLLDSIVIICMVIFVTLDQSIWNLIYSRIVMISIEFV